MELGISTPEKERYWIAIGRIVTEMASLESAILLTIPIVVKIEAGLFISMVASERFDTLLKIFDSIFPYAVKDETLQKEFHALWLRMDKINKDRNEFIHRLILITDAPTTERLKFIRGKAGALYQLKVDELKVTDLEELVSRIQTAKTKTKNQA
jgi:hypothetical protein